MLDHLDIGVLERRDLPEALRRRARAVVGGIEDVVEPVLRVLVLLILAQMDRDQQRGVEEQLPVIDRIGAARGEIEIFDRIRLRDIVASGV